LTNAQLYLAVGLPTLAILSTLAANLFLVSGIREDIREIRSDIKLIAGKLAELDTRVSLIEQKLH